jgi:hypothetical protein
MTSELPDWLQEMETRALQDYCVLMRDWLAQLADAQDMSPPDAADKVKWVRAQIDIQRGELAALCECFSDIDFGPIPDNGDNPEATLSAMLAWCDRAKRLLRHRSLPELSERDIDIARYIWLYPGHSPTVIANGLTKKFDRYKKAWEERKLFSDPASLGPNLKRLLHWGFRSQRGSYFPPPSCGAPWEQPRDGCDQPLPKIPE